MNGKSFLGRMLPLIDRAAEAARDKSKRVIADGHILWQVYINERERLLTEAVNVHNDLPPSDSGVRVSKDEFEAYLITLSGGSESTVWAWDTEEDPAEEVTEGQEDSKRV